jgi:hypothetical protein
MTKRAECVKTDMESTVFVARKHSIDVGEVQMIAEACYTPLQANRHTHTHTQAHTCVQTHTNTHIQTQTHTDTHMHTHTHTWMGFKPAFSASVYGTTSNASANARTQMLSMPCIVRDDGSLYASMWECICACVCLCVYACVCVF